VADWAEPMLETAELRTVLDRVYRLDDELLALAAALRSVPKDLAERWGRTLAEAVSLIEDLRGPKASNAERLRRLLPERERQELKARAERARDPASARAIITRPLSGGA
jgi:hypothetical protein